jgi:hypothetical protein
VFPSNNQRKKHFHKHHSGGSQQKLPEFCVEPCSAREAAAFVVAHHYTHSAKGMTPTHTYRVVNKQTGRMLGAAIFGIPGQTQTLRKYNGNGNLRLVELRRLVLLDAAPKNSESRVLSVMFRLLRQEGIQRVLSYADPNEVRADHPDGKHTGLIYRATGFHKVKEVLKTKAIWWNGRRYPIRNLDQYNNYHSEPDFWNQVPEDKKILREEKHRHGTRWVWVPKIPTERIGIAQKLHAALADGSAVMKKESGKIAYVKDLERGLPYFDTPCRNSKHAGY